MACHGKQETGEPMKSSLLLHDKILELSEVVRHALLRADFAFLSACQTAVGDERITDESVQSSCGHIHGRISWGNSHDVINQGSRRAANCGGCTREDYKEWKTE